MSRDRVDKSVYIICTQCSEHLVLDSELKDIECGRCGYQVKGCRSRYEHRPLIFSLTALIFYFPAMMFPFMKMEVYGSVNSATIWGGVRSLMESGSWFIAGIIFLASVVIPLLKLLILFYLSASRSRLETAYFKTQLLKSVELIGRWSMLDIFLLAVLVAVFKLGPWARVEPEIGSLMFALVVIFTMFASASFDSRVFWQEETSKGKA